MWVAGGDINPKTTTLAPLEANVVQAGARFRMCIEPRDMFGNDVKTPVAFSAHLSGSETRTVVPLKLRLIAGHLVATCTPEVADKYTVCACVRPL
jgi:hypothetical protein